MKRTKPANSANYWRNSKNESRNNSLCQSAGTRKTNIFILVLSFALTGFLFFGIQKSYADGEVVINEAMFNPEGADGSLEWVELFNNGDSEISLENWDLDPDGGSYRSLSGLIIGPQEYLLVGGISGTRNDRGQISLYNSKTHNESTMVDYVQYGSWDLGTTENNVRDRAVVAGIWNDGDFAIVPKEGKTLERITDGSDSDSPSDWQESFKNDGTPGTSNSKAEPPVVYSKKMVINELLPDPLGSPEKDYEFVEIYNNDDKEVDLSSWEIKDKTGSFSLNGIIESGGYVFFYDTVSFNNDGDEITLLDPNGEIVSEVNYGKAEENLSYSKKEDKWKWTSWLTPGAKNIFDEDISYPEGVYINEILPDPKGDEEKKEYIELFNSNEKDVDLFKWMLKDSGKTSKYIFPEKSEIKSEDYLLVKRADFNFALNNSGDEEVSLLNPAGKVVSQVKYDGSDENVSYNFTGRIWRWSRYLTPGEPNRFNNLPQVKVEKDDKIYEDIYAEFKAEVKDPDKDEIKVTWDFGDGHKSYLEETKHKYEKKGKYKVILKVTDGSEEMLREFKIEVEEFPEYDMEFFTICPNPSGSDTENEWLVVKNESDEEVNLKNWSIATGWDNLYNHPIYEDLEIDGGELKVIKRDVCKFTLHNQQAKLELRYPNGKTAAEIEYDRDNSTADDEIYQKTRDGWIWIAPKAEEIAEVSPRVAEILGEEIFTDDLSYFLGGQSLAGIRNYRLSLMKFILNQNLAEIIAQNSGKVLGVSTNKELGNRYIFTRDNRIRDHYFISFLKNTGRKINYLTNTIINKLN